MSVLNKRFLKIIINWIQKPSGNHKFDIYTLVFNLLLTDFEHYVYLYKLVASIAMWVMIVINVISPGTHSLQYE
jgi:hypothetical protein